MYIPESSKNLKDLSFPQIRLGLQGESGTGKSFSALTFPNPFVVDFDGSLTAHAGRDIPTAPFYDEEWVEKYAGGAYKRQLQHVDAFANRRDALLHFLQKEALKFTKDQTLIIDSWSAVQLAFDNQTSKFPKKTKEGAVDDFAFWADKIEYSEKLCVFFMSVKCHVVVTFHEDPVRNKTTGELMSKIAPLMQGKFVVQLKRFFTDFFRTVVQVEKDPATGQEKKAPTFLWQVRSDNKFDAKSRLKRDDMPTFVEPHFKIFQQYAGENNQ